MITRGFMKLFHDRNSWRERIKHLDETIIQLVQYFMDCDNVNKRIYYEMGLDQNILIIQL